MCSTKTEPWALPFAAGIMIAAAGCVSERLAPEVSSYNFALARAQNEMLLLNIARAAKFKPLYLVDVSKITGSLKGEVTGKVGVGFDGGPDYAAAGNNLATIGGTYSVNPTFDVNLLNGQDFMKGFIHAVTADQLSVLFDNRWSRELLLHLFVREVEFENKAVVRLRNQAAWHQETQPEMVRFGRWVTGFCACRPRVVACGGVRQKLGPTVTKESVENVNVLVSLGKEEFQVDEMPVAGQGSRYQLLGKEEFRTVAVVPEDYDGPCPVFEKTGGLRSEEPREAHVNALACDKKTRVRFHLRSPDAVLRYLGAVVRFEAMQHRIPQLVIGVGCVNGKCNEYEVISLFVAAQTNLADDETRMFLEKNKADVKVTDDEGDTYVIPRERWLPPKASRSTAVVLKEDEAFARYLLAEGECRGPGMSPDALAILSQLISLHKSAKELGSTPLVRAIAQ